MFHLIGKKEVEFILQNDDDSFEGIASRAIKTYRSRPGFFTPYRSGEEFTGELIAPILYPLAGTVVAAFSIFAAGVAAAVCVGSLLFTAAVAFGGASQLRDEALEFTGLALTFTGVALLTAAVSALLAVISIPHSLSSLVTRSVSILLVAESTVDALDEEEHETIESYNTCFQN